MEIAYVLLISIGLLEGLYICRKQRERNELIKQDNAIERAIEILRKDIESNGDN